VPPHTRVKNEKTWHTLSTPIFSLHTNTHIPSFPNYTFALPLKFSLEYIYYTNGSFTPPKQTAPNTWCPERASYGVYNSIKNLQTSECLLGLLGFFFLGCMQPESTQKNFLATKGIKFQEFFWMKKPNVNHGLLNFG
jgi:hypothetical protein